MTVGEVEEEILVLPPTFVNELKDAPEDVLSLDQYMADMGLHFSRSHPSLL